MKKMTRILLFFTILFTAVSIMPVISKAANQGYSMNITYSGDVIEGKEKEAKAILSGQNATPYAHVRFNVNVTGPATPKMLATDSNGTTIDIMEYGYWGPKEGFPAGGTFNNETLLKVTFPKAGEYTIKLDLVNMDNNEEVIDTITKTITVKAVETPTEPTEPEKPTEQEKPAEKDETPKTGVVTYVGTAIAVLAISTMALITLKNKKA